MHKQGSRWTQAAGAGWLAGILLSLAGWAFGAQEDETAPACPASPDVRVIGANVRDHQDACEGAKAALAFFAAHGLRPTEPLVLEVTPDVPGEAGPTAAGCYLEENKRVYMLPHAAFRRQRTWFNVPIDRALYRSLAAHETAHAIAACHFTIPRPSIEAKEYVAYVATFSAMDDALRARVLRATPGEGFAGEDKITAMFFMFDPMRFGAEAYRHYMRPENGAVFLRAVLAGKALSERAP